MKFKTWFGGSGLVLLFAAALLIGCGDKAADEGTKGRGGMPMHRVKLRNTSPPEGPPATAEVVVSKGGQPAQTLSVGPVPPGGESETPVDPPAPADGVTITVDVGVTLVGEGSFPGADIEAVEIEAGPQGGSAVVTFHMGQPPQAVPLTPQ